jgi:hypothetical protein
MTDKFPKDEWILEAIRIGYLIVDEDSTVWRRTSISADGKRMSAQVRRVKMTTHKKSGRVFFNMTFKGVTKSVLLNRIVALRYLPNPFNLPQVNHIDGDKQHNYLRQPTDELKAIWGEYQLEWSTGQDNEKHAHRTGLKTGRGSQNSNAKLTAADVLEIRASEETPAELAKRKGVARSTISNILAEKTWTHL